MTDTASEVASASQLRVLVVDDYPDAASAACELVKLLGHQCQFALDGRSALAAIAANYAPDLVILDIGLPDISGYDLAPRVRELLGGRTVVIAAMTGWGQPEDHERSAAAGFDGHYTKPTSVAMVQRILLLARERAHPGSAPT